MGLGWCSLRFRSLRAGAFFPGGTGGPKSQLPPSICTPSLKEMEAHLAAAVESIGAASVFVASDRALSKDMARVFSKYGYTHLETGMNEVDGKSPPGGAGSPQIDLAILSMADHAVLHCPSSFSVRRLQQFSLLPGPRHKENARP